MAFWNRKPAAPVTPSPAAPERKLGVETADYWKTRSDDFSKAVAGHWRSEIEKDPSTKDAKQDAVFSRHGIGLPLAAGLDRNAEVRKLLERDARLSNPEEFVKNPTARNLIIEIARKEIPGVAFTGSPVLPMSATAERRQLKEYCGGLIDDVVINQYLTELTGQIQAEATKQVMQEQAKKSQGWLSRWGKRILFGSPLVAGALSIAGVAAAATAFPWVIGGVGLYGVIDHYRRNSKQKELQALKENELRVDIRRGVSGGANFEAFFTPLISSLAVEMRQKVMTESGFLAGSSLDVAARVDAYLQAADAQEVVKREREHKDALDKIVTDETAKARLLGIDTLADRNRAEKAAAEAAYDTNDSEAKRKIEVVYNACEANVQALLASGFVAYPAGSSLDAKRLDLIAQLDSVMTAWPPAGSAGGPAQADRDAYTHLRDRLNKLYDIALNPAEKKHLKDKKIAEDNLVQLLYQDLNALKAKYPAANVDFTHFNNATTLGTKFETKMAALQAEAGKLETAINGSTSVDIDDKHRIDRAIVWLSLATSDPAKALKGYLYQDKPTPSAADEEKYLLTELGKVTGTNQAEARRIKKALEDARAGLDPAKIAEFETKQREEFERFRELKKVALVALADVAKQTETMLAVAPVQQKVGLIGKFIDRTFSLADRASITRDRPGLAVLWWGAAALNRLTTSMHLPQTLGEHAPLFGVRNIFGFVAGIRMGKMIENSIMGKIGSLGDLTTIPFENPAEIEAKALREYVAKASVKMERTPMNSTERAKLARQLEQAKSLLALDLVREKEKQVDTAQKTLVEVQTATADMMVAVQGIHRELGDAVTAERDAQRIARERAKTKVRAWRIATALGGAILPSVLTYAHLEWRESQEHKLHNWAEDGLKDVKPLPVSVNPVKIGGPPNVPDHITGHVSQTSEPINPHLIHDAHPHHDHGGGGVDHGAPPRLDWKGSTAGATAATELYPPAELPVEPEAALLVNTNVSIENPDAHHPILHFTQPDGTRVTATLDAHAHDRLIPQADGTLQIHDSDIGRHLPGWNDRAVIDPKTLTLDDIKALKQDGVNLVEDYQVEQPAGGVASRADAYTAAPSEPVVQHLGGGGAALPVEVGADPAVGEHLATSSSVTTFNPDQIRPAGDGTLDLGAWGTFKMQMPPTSSQGVELLSALKSAATDPVKMADVLSAHRADELAPVLDPNLSAVRQVLAGK